MKRVVITGLGTINSIGHSVNESFEAAVNGTNQVLADRIRLDDGEGTFDSH